MSTPNFKTQDDFKLYASNMLYDILDENYEPTGEYDFDEVLCDATQSFIDDVLNKQLEFFDITLESGYYGGVQSYVVPRTIYYGDDSYDFLYYYEDYDGKDIYKEFGYNKHVLKQKILKEIKFINEKLLPQLEEYTFEQIECVAIFSNGEAVYERVKKE